MNTTYTWSRAAKLCLALIVLPLLTACGQQQPAALNNNNVWNPFGNNGGIVGGCAPITGPITFSGQQVYMDYANIVGGFLPYSANNLGQIYVGAGAMGLPQAGFGQQMSSNYGAYGQMQMVVTQLLGFSGQMGLPYQGYPFQNTAQFPTGFPQQPWTGGNFMPNSWNPNFVSVQGSIQLSPNVISIIMSQMGFGNMGAFGGTYPFSNFQNPFQNFQYPGTFNGFGQFGQVPCVSTMGMNVGRWNNLIYGGQVFLYINGTQNFATIEF